jgi:hypothetical protein
VHVKEVRLSEKALAKLGDINSLIDKLGKMEAETPEALFTQHEVKKICLFFENFGSHYKGGPFTFGGVF